MGVEAVVTQALSTDRFPNNNESNIASLVSMPTAVKSLLGFFCNTISTYLTLGMPLLPLTCSLH